MAIDKHPGDSPIKAILENQRGVVTDMFLTDWNEEEYREVIKEEAREEGLAEGREKGLAEGREEGREEGRTEGREEGEQRLGALMTKLLSLGKTEDAMKASSDSDFRNRLYKQYGL